MKLNRIAFSLITVIALAGVLGRGIAAAESTKVRVSAHAAIERGDVAAAQNDALTEALQKAVEKVLGQIVPERTYAALEPLLEARIIPQTELFISHYQIVNQDVSDRSYTVHLSVTVDTELLRKNLSSIGVIKEPGSPPLAAVFVTVDAPLGLDHVRSLGVVADRAVTEALDGNSFVIIPAPVSGQESTGFRVVRPPQAPEALVSEGLLTLADLAVGVQFKKSGSAMVTGSTMNIPMYVTIQAVDVQTGTLVDVVLQDVDISMGTVDGALLTKDLDQTIGEMATRISGKLTERYQAGETKRGAVGLVFEGSHDASSVRYILNEIQFRLGESTYILPESFSHDRSQYTIWTPRGPGDVMDVLTAMKVKPRPFTAHQGEGGVVVTMDGEVQPAGVLEFGEEVAFYRRLPVPGIENPDDLRKIEFVPWQEFENNSEAGTSNIAPLGMGILGRIDPPRDLDFFRFQLPEGTSEVSVLVEQTGPGEVRARVRVFSGGSLLDDQISRRRGTNLYFTLPVQPGIRELQLSVEDFLGRYPSMFPYVLKVGVSGSVKADEPT